MNPAVTELLFACRSLGLHCKADPNNPDGPLRAHCPLCKTYSGLDELPLTIRSNGLISCSHGCDTEKVAAALDIASAETSATTETIQIEVVSLENFATTDEPGADALLGDGDSILIAEGSDVMVYGDGGAGKTTLMSDAACHLGTGKAWLGVPIKRRARVLIIEAEGPRPLLRQKFSRKLTAWDGPALDGHVRILESPWASFTFASEDWRRELALILEREEIDVVIAGPLTRIGMDSAGTLQEVVSFMGLINDVRSRCPRRLTVILIHHENKGGAVSGAWEGAGDTLVQVQAAGPGRTVVYIQKARWSSEHHGKSLHLKWTDGEGFELEAERDLLTDVKDLLADGLWRTGRRDPQGR